VYCLADSLNHTTCLKEIADDLEHCARKLLQKIGEVDAIMEDQDKKPTNEMWPQNDSEFRTVCW
jgi:hypothetical protein